MDTGFQAGVGFRLAYIPIPAISSPWFRGYNCLLSSLHLFREHLAPQVSPTNDLDMRLRLRFGYPYKLKRKGSKILHDMFCSKLDSKGEASHDPLSDCVASVVKEFNENNLILWVNVP